MNANKFHDQLDDDKIIAAIAAAERRTTGEIRVFVTRRALGRDDLLTRARSRFEKLGMTATAERNGVLLYFIPRDRRFAILGDRGIDERCGADFWRDIAARLNEHLRAGEFTAGIVAAIGSVGEALAAHFPASPDDRNELPNGVGRD